MEHSFFLTVYTASFFLPTWKAPWRGARLSQSAVAFGERRWAGYPLRFMSVCWSYSQWISGFVPRAFGSGNRSWLSSALLHWTTVQSIHPCCRPWMGCLRVLHLETDVVLRFQWSHGQQQLEGREWEAQPAWVVLLLDFCADHSLSIMKNMFVSISAHGTKTP